MTQARVAHGGNGGRGIRAYCDTPAFLADANREMRRHGAPEAPSVPSQSNGVSLRRCTRSLSLSQRSPHTIVATMLIGII